MVIDKSNGDVLLQDHLRAIRRLMDMLEINGEAVGEELANDPRVMVSFFLNDHHRHMLGMELFKVGFTWTRKMLQGMLVFCDYHIDAIDKIILKSDESGPWQKYISSLKLLKSQLRGGYTKRLMQEKTRRMLLKKVEDLKKVELLPPRAVFKTCIHQAMITLKYIVGKYAGAETIPAAALAEANCCLVGKITCDGFAGRCMELSKVSLAHALEQLSQGLDYFEFKEHKTSIHYGELAKWFAPGTIEAIKAYLTLPRRSGVKTLFMPVGEDTEFISWPGTLYRFAKRYLPEKHQRPTVNLMRKMFHNKLVEETETKEKCFEFMQAM